jgi:hypothetical protein
LSETIKRLKKGETTLRDESKVLGFTHNGPLRNALREKIGKEAYDKLPFWRPQRQGPLKKYKPVKKAKRATTDPKQLPTEEHQAS